MTITMIDYGIGNYRSVQKALEFVGAEVELTADPGAIQSAEKLLLPGVGAFGAAIDAIRARNQETAIKTAVAAGTPFLGICVGMQLLFDTSDELTGKSAEPHHGLSLISGHVAQFPETVGKVPHMGWNQLEHDGACPLLDGVSPNAYAYFVHSFYCAPVSHADSAASTSYGLNFTSVVQRDNVFGVQFHTEKSQQVGLKILRNFVNL